MPETHDEASEALDAFEALLSEQGDDLDAETITLTAGPEGDRLDKWLARQLPDRSRSEVQRWIAAARVTCAGTEGQLQGCARRRHRDCAPRARGL
jgi:hypothetical protein